MPLRLNLMRDVSDRWALTLSSNVVHSLARRGITNNDNSGTSYYAVIPFTPNFVDLRPGPNGVYPSNPFIGSTANPLQTAALMKNDEDVWRIIAAADSNYRLWGTNTQQLNFKVNGGLDRFQQVNSLLFPPELNFEQAGTQPGTSLYATSA